VDFLCSLSIFLRGKYKSAKICVKYKNLKGNCFCFSTNKQHTQSHEVSHDHTQTIAMVMKTYLDGDKMTTEVKVVSHVEGKPSMVCQWNNEYLRVRVYCDKPEIDALVMVTHTRVKLSGCPKHASFTMHQQALTIEEWKQQGGVTLANGTYVYVMGREMYKVSRARKGDSMYCSCPAWKFQNLHPLRRTCKHCEAVCGKENEAIRIALATVCILQKKNIKVV
jgi:hypothetical protein